MRNNVRGERISVLISDGTRMGCEALSHALAHFSHEIAVTSSAVSFRELIENAQSRSPEIAVIGTELQDGPGTGIIAIRELKKMCPQVSSIAMLDKQIRHLTVDAFCAGARGVVFRSEGLDQLVNCIRNVRAGRLWTNNDGIEELVTALTTAISVRAVAANGAELLTSRQKQIVALVSEGLSNREISERLHLSEHTVKNYLFRIFDKLGVSSRAELIIYTMHTGQRWEH